jgi:sortase A
MRRGIRLLGTLLAVAGALTLVWALLVWQWQDPFTGLYTKWKQRQLASQYDKRTRTFEPTISGDTQAAERKSIAREAKRYRKSSGRGEVIGRLRVPRMGVNMLLVNGTDHDTLKKGPGRDERTFMPGENRLVYIAGHRTTYLAPFAHIDDIELGDYITFSLPYATFTYRVQRHYIVRSDQLSVLQDHGREILRLQACHPRFFATHRYIVDATLASFTPTGGETYLIRAAAS